MSGHFVILSIFFFLVPLTSKVPRTKKSINMMVSNEASLRIKKLKSSYESDTTLNKLQVC